MFTKIDEVCKQKKLDLNFMRDLIQSTLEEGLAIELIKAIDLLMQFSSQGMEWRADFVVKAIIAAQTTTHDVEWRSKTIKYLLDRNIENFAKTSLVELVRTCHEHSWRALAEDIVLRIESSDSKFNAVYREHAKNLISKEMDFLDAWRLLQAILKSPMSHASNASSALKDLIGISISNQTPFSTLEELFGEFMEYCDTRCIIGIKI